MEMKMTLGEIIQCISILVGAASIYFKLSERLKALEIKVDLMFQSWTDEHNRVNLK